MRQLWQEDVTDFPLKIAQINLLYHQGISGIRGSLLAAIIMTVALWNQTPRLSLIIWLAFYVVACGVGEALFQSFRKTNPVDKSILSWAKYYVLVSITGGLLWGSASVFLFPENSIFHQVFLTFVQGGMSVGIVSSHGAMRAAYLPFILLVYVPLIGRYCYEGDEIHFTMGILLFVFMTYLVGYAIRIQATITESLKLRFQNEQLIDKLNREKIATDALNEILKSEILERNKAEDALRDSEERYRQLFEISPHPMTVHNGKVFLLVNPASARLHKVSHPNDLHGKSIWDFTYPDCLDEVQNKLKRIITGNEPVHISEIKALALDGTVSCIEVASVATCFKGAPAILSIGRDITEAKKSEERLKASLEEKELLLREVHHRVKNNLQIISSLLKLQSRYVGEKSIQNVLDDIENRLQSMALIHEKLYQSKDLSRIDLKSYLDSLVSHLFQVVGTDSTRITLKKSVQQIELGVEIALPCGLILNELVSNCLKHAFPGGGQGEIQISVKSVEGKIELMVADNGIGTPISTDISNVKTLGLRLVHALVNQLHGELTIDNAKGTCFKIVFQKLPTPLP